VRDLGDPFPDQIKRPLYDGPSDLIGPLSRILHNRIFDLMG
jgi:hypothetical protein